MNNPLALLSVVVISVLTGCANIPKDPTVLSTSTTDLRQLTTIMGVAGGSVCKDLAVEQTVPMVQSALRRSFIGVSSSTYYPTRTETVVGGLLGSVGEEFAIHNKSIPNGVRVAVYRKELGLRNPFEDRNGYVFWVDIRSDHPACRAFITPFASKYAFATVYGDGASAQRLYIKSFLNAMPK